MWRFGEVGLGDVTFLGFLFFSLTVLEVVDIVVESMQWLCSAGVSSIGWGCALAAASISGERALLYMAFQSVFPVRFFGGRDDASVIGKLGFRGVVPSVKHLLYVTSTWFLAYSRDHSLDVQKSFDDEGPATSEIVFTVESSERKVFITSKDLKTSSLPVEGVNEALNPDFVLTVTSSCAMSSACWFKNSMNSCVENMVDREIVSGILSLVLIALIIR